jgi:hypothetical protein
MPTTPDEVTCTIRDVTGPNSRGEIGAVSTVETGPSTGASQRDALLVRGGHVITMDPGPGDMPGGDVLVRSAGALGLDRPGRSAGAGRGYRPAGASDAVSCAGRASVWYTTQ